MICASFSYGFMIWRSAEPREFPVSAIYHISSSGIQNVFGPISTDKSSDLWRNGSTSLQDVVL